MSQRRRRERTMRTISAVLGLVAAIVLSAATALAAEPAPASGAGAAPAAPASAAVTPSEEDKLLSAEQLEALVAAIALYPDDLLANILMASTYPLEVIEADRFAKKSKNLKGDQLAAA